MSENRSVLVTGIGIYTSIGSSREEFWTSLVAGKSGIKRIQAFDPNYTPPLTAHDMELWDQKQSWMYSCYRKTLKFSKGEQLVHAHREDYDAQMLTSELVAHAKTSTAAILTARNMLATISSLKLDNTWKRSAMEFITDFCRLMDNYNDQQTTPETWITDIQKKNYLMAAVSKVSALRGVVNRENDDIARGQPAYLWDQYLTSLEGAAATIDEGRMNRGSSRYDIHWVDTGDDTNEQEGTEDPTTSDIELLINEAHRGNGRFAAKMNKATWDSLSEGSKKVWDQLQDSDKAKILQYSAQRGNSPMKANTHQLGIMEKEEDVEEPPPSPDDDDNPGIEANQALSEARGDAHPGDIRRLMGDTTRPKREVGFHYWNGSHHSTDDTDNLIDQHWDDEDECGRDFH
jgi:hypothetical protein